MPVGLVRKWTVVATLAAAIGLVACKEDEDPPIMGVDSGNPGGGSDSGSPGGGGMDAGADSGGGGSDSGGSDSGMNYGEAGTPCPGWTQGPLTCGSNTCYWHKTTLTCSNPGCLTVNDASVCAIDTNTLGGVDAGLPEFLPYNAPGVDSPACGEVGDSFEAIPDGGIVDGGSKGNGLIDTNRTIMMIPIALRYPGCCTSTGWCSGNTSNGMASAAGTPYGPASAGFGCLNHLIFYGANPNAMPTRCDPATGALVDGGAGEGGAEEGGAEEGGAEEGGAEEGGTGDGG